MCLFPDIETCLARIEAYPQQNRERLANIRENLLARGENEDTQQILIKTLRSWSAFRNQRGRINQFFLTELLTNNYLKNIFYELIEFSCNEKSLSNILLFKKEKIFIIYNYFQNSIFQNGDVARILPLSKTILTTLGISVGFDSINILKEINRASSTVKFYAGIWEFCHFFEALRFIATEQNKWELAYGPMKDLAENLPICQIMDSVLWHN